MKRLILLGSTGSIGTQALDVAERLGYTVTALAAHSNVDKIEEQIHSNPDMLNNRVLVFAGESLVGFGRIPVFTRIFFTVSVG